MAKPADTDDRDLLSRLHQGESRAFQTIFHRYYAPLCIYAEKYVGSDDAEDVVEDIFLNIYRRKELFQNEYHLKSHLYLSTRNKCLNFLKTRKNAQERAGTYLEDQVLHEEGHVYDIIRAEIYRELFQAIEELPEQCRKILRLTYLEGMTNPEVAALMGLSVHTVKNQKLRGIALLKAKFPKREYLLLLQLIPYLHLLPPAMEL